MLVPPYFQILEGYAVFRPIGRATLSQAAEMVRLSIELAKRERVAKEKSVLL